MACCLNLDGCHWDLPKALIWHRREKQRSIYRLQTPPCSFLHVFPHLVPIHQQDHALAPASRFVRLHEPALQPSGVLLTYEESCISNSNNHHSIEWTCWIPPLAWSTHTLRMNMHELHSPRYSE